MARAERTAATRPASRRRSGATGPTVVLLVRHGVTETTGKELPGRAPGLHLSEAGRKQAEGAAARILSLSAPPPNGDGKSAAKPRVAAVYSSPLERTRETAAPISGALGLDVVPDEGLIELDMGDWTGLELKAAMNRK